MTSYTVNIYDVSDDHQYTIITFYKSEALKFLKTYDHEGSTIDMVIKNDGDDGEYKTIHNSEEIYMKLSAEVEIK